MIVRVFLTGVSQSIGLDLTNDALLQKQLVSHIDSTLGRLINGDLPTYHFKDELIERNQAVFDALKQNISILEKSLHCKFNEDALSYIMMHVIASIERTYIANPVRACIVCNAGVASGVYLAERLRNYCKLDIIATIPGHKLQMLLESSVEKPDLIISVIPLPPQSIPVITIPPLPTEKSLPPSRTPSIPCFRSDGTASLPPWTAVRSFPPSCPSRNTPSGRFSSRIWSCRSAAPPPGPRPSRPQATC